MAFLESNLPASLATLPGARPYRGALLAQEHIIAAFYRLTKLHRKLALICAEPGSGKSFALACITQEAHKNKIPLKNLIFSNTKALDALSLVREMRDKLPRTFTFLEGAVVTIDDMPALEEPQLNQFKQIVESILEMGVTLIITINPEAHTLVESLRPSWEITSKDLQRPQDEEVTLVKVRHIPQRLYTQGVALLERTFYESMLHQTQGNQDSISSSAYFSRTYLKNLAHMVKVSLRPSLAAEELRLRLAMILLGSGTLVDLERVLGSVDYELFSQLDETSPFFGVTCVRKAFSVAGFAIHNLVPQVGVALMKTVQSEPELTARCAMHLLGRHKVMRAAAICNLNSYDARIQAVIRQHAAELACAGYIVLLQPLVLTRTKKSTCIQKEEITPAVLSEAPAPEAFYTQMWHEMTAPYKTVIQARYVWDEAKREFLSGMAKDCPVQKSHVELLACAAHLRDVLAGKLEVEGVLTQESSSVPPFVDDTLDFMGDNNDMMLELGQAFVLNAEICRNLLQGKFLSAYQLLQRMPFLPADDATLAARLCSVQLSALEMVLGVTAPQREEQTDSKPDKTQGSQISLHTLEDEINQNILMQYAESFSEIVQLMCGQTSELHLAKSLVNTANARGDRAIEAYLLGGLALEDFANKAYRRSFVRAQRTLDFAHELNLTYIADIAQMIMMGTSYLLGDPCHIEDMKFTDEVIKELTELFCQSIHGLTQTKKASALLDLPYKKLNSKKTRQVIEYAWIATFLSSYFGSTSTCFFSALPPEWQTNAAKVVGLSASAFEGVRHACIPAQKQKKTTDKTRKTAAKSSTVRSMAEPPSEIAFLKELKEVGFVGQNKRVRVSLLGKFRIEVDGELLEPVVYNRRRSKEVLSILAFTQGHKINKRKMVEMLWGDCDLFGGSKKLYEAIACTRRVLRSKELGYEPILSERNGGFVSSDSDYVAYDIDDFKRLCMVILMNEGEHEKTLQLVLMANKMYESGLGYKPLEPTGEIEAAINELEKLYVDINVCASKAALLVNKALLASQFARIAQRCDDMREDCMTALIEALLALDCKKELLHEYSLYRARLKTALGILPPQNLQELVVGVIKEFCKSNCVGSFEKTQKTPCRFSDWANVDCAMR